MKIDELIIEYLSRSITDVFSTMLGVDLGVGEISVENSAPEANDGVVSFIGLAGSWVGTGSLACSPVLACRICDHMLMTETSAVNEEVLDAVAELTNMIVGSVKTELEKHVGPLGLSIPTVVFGRNFKTKSAGTNEWTVARFHWDGELLLVKVCLAPKERAAHAVYHSIPQACGIEV
jgi:chemotaxis protein CheX